MKAMYDTISKQCSKNITLQYSTSFSLGIKLLSKDIQSHIYNIYGFVRLADEVVDTFHGYPQKKLLLELEEDTFQAIEDGISLNPVLQSFQETVNTFQIEEGLIRQFLHSMKMDLEPQEYTQDLYKEYIVGSAEVVGLMCLQVFTNGDKAQYEALKSHAEALGSVFQKVNFLRDLHFDYTNLDRSYFPNLNVNNVQSEELENIFQEIEDEFAYALEGIRKLPNSCKFGVFLAYRYYHKLFLKIRRTESSQLLEQRIRIPNGYKALILLKSMVRHQLKWY